jgi:Arc-like DNA binding domain
MPAQLRDQLKSAAAASGRSLNAELVDRLERSLAAERRRMSSKDASRHRRPEWRRSALAAVGVAGVIATAVVAGALTRDSGAPATAPPNVAEAVESGAISPALREKLAASTRFSPGEPAYEQGEAVEGGGDGAHDWSMHASPGTNIPLAAISASRQDWAKVKARANAGGLGGQGRWDSLGPDPAVYPLNPFRSRYVYVPNEYLAGGRTAHSVIDPSCGPARCRYWIANAGGGIWRTDNAFAEQPKWEFISPTFQHNNTAALELDPNDPTSEVLYAGTGEPNTCRSGCIAGVGMYSSRDGGDHWSGPIGGQYFSGRGIGAIEVKPGESSTIFVATGAHGSRGLSSTCCTGVDRGATIPGAPHFGLWRSTDGGVSFALVNQGNPANCTDKTPTQVFLGQSDCSVRGARRVKVDPVDSNTVYASFYAKGIWRSNSNGDPGTWTQIFAPLAPPIDPATGAGVERAEFDVVAQPDGTTRMYVGVGGGGSLSARFYRSDSVRIGTPSFTNLTNNTSGGYCDPQCSYDNYVYVPVKADGTAHSPDTVYLLGSNMYGEAASGESNGRAILLSTNAGASFSDMTYDATDDSQPHGAHPDQHSIVTNPANWRQFLETGDGGVIRSDGGPFVDDSGDCTAVHELTGSALARCLAVTSRIPARLEAVNDGLNTIHFYQLTYNPNRPGELAGGTQDNGSWMSVPGTRTWVETFVADGGYAGFDAVDPNYSVLESQNGGIRALDEPRNQQAVFWIADTLRTALAAPFRYDREAVAFSAPTLFHPEVAKLMFTGREHAFRSLNGGVNPAFAYEKVKQHCNTWTGDGDIDEDGTYERPTDVCDDWKAMGDPGHLGRLTYGPSALCPPAANPAGAWTVACPAPYPWGDDRSGGHVSMVEPSASNPSVVWAGTSGGRIFVTTNAGAANATTIAWRRIDQTSTVDPPRYPSDIYVDPSDPYHAYISYSGYNAVTPATPGHVFEVRFDQATGNATFTSLDGTGSHSLGDVPVGTIERDEAKGVLYIGTDFGIVQRVRPQTGWTPVAPGLPTTTIPSLDIDQERRVMYVTTHGFGAWSLKLP